VSCAHAPVMKIHKICPYHWAHPSSDYHNYYITTSNAVMFC